jgi:hypothetical protein
MIEQYGSGPPTNKKRNIREEDVLTSATLWNTNSMRGASFDQQQLPTFQPNTDSGDWAPFDQRITSNSGSNEFNIINLTKGNPIKLEKSFSEHSDGSGGDGMHIQAPHPATLAQAKRDFPNNNNNSNNNNNNSNNNHKPLIGQLQPGYDGVVIRIVCLFLCLFFFAVRNLCHFHSFQFCCNLILPRILFFASHSVVRPRVPISLRCCSTLSSTTRRKETPQRLEPGPSAMTTEVGRTITRTRIAATIILAERVLRTTTAAMGWKLRCLLHRPACQSVALGMAWKCKAVG